LKKLIVIMVVVILAAGAGRYRPSYPEYLRTDGTRPLTGDWNMGPYDLTGGVDGTFSGTVAAGGVDLSNTGNVYFDITSTDHGTTGFRLFRTGDAYRDWTFTNQSGYVLFASSINDGSTWTSVFKIDSGYVDFLLDKPFRIGVGQDLQLGHNGTNSYITNSTGDLQITSAGDITLGDASTDTITCTGRFIPRQVGADPTSSATAGERGEIVRFGDVWYGKTVGTGTDTNWSPFN